MKAALQGAISAQLRKKQQLAFRILLMLEKC